MKLAIVVQRYGEHVIGGAETHSRLLAERLAGQHDVSVFTTAATDYRTWANDLPAGIETLNGIRVLRFPVRKKRRWRYFGWTSKRLFFSPHSTLDEYRWIIRQGPECPDLLDYIQQKCSMFDVFIFFTYLYYPTFFGLPLAARKAVLVPTAHDEPAIHLRLFYSLFHLPRFVAFNTEEERRFVHTTFQNEYIPSAVIGVGVDVEPPSNRDEGYLLYAGRIEHGKNCDELFEFAQRLRFPLRVIGHAQIPIPNHVRYLGAVSEAEKKRLIAGCRALIHPSRNESLSLTVLEAWAHGKPVIVSAHSQVLRAQIEKSGGGYTYRDYEQFRTILQNLDPAKGLIGRKYLQQNYSWPKVLQAYDQVFSLLMQSESRASQVVSPATGKAGNL